MAKITHSMLKESREKFGTLFDSNMIGIAITDLDEAVLDANQAFLDIIGYERRDVELGRLRWSAITPERYEDIDRKKVNELLRTGEMRPFEKEYLHKKGYAVPVLVGAACINLDPTLSVCFALDIGKQKELEKKKDEFIGTVSHELRTPLAVLKMQASLLQDEITSGASVKQLLESVRDMDLQIDRLNVLITDLLNLARLTDGQAFPFMTAFDVRSCVSRVVDDISLVTSRRIVFKPGKGRPMVRGSEMRIAQVITNLVANACRYSADSTTVEVAIEEGQRTVKIRIKDKGIGISKNQLDKIFKRYHRVAHAEDYTLGSTGIGLHVASEIVKQHKGRIEVKSSPGKGSTFCCILPRAESVSVRKEKKQQRKKAPRKASRRTQRATT